MLPRRQTPSRLSMLKGVLSIFLAIFFALGFACLASPGSVGGANAVSLFVSYLILIALFGLLAMEMAISENFREFAPWVGIVFVLEAVFFVWRSFYKMRIDDTIDNIINAYDKK